jgi:hypothetical protein
LAKIKPDWHPTTFSTATPSTIDVFGALVFIPLTSAYFQHLQWIKPDLKVDLHQPSVQIKRRL